MWVMVFAPFAPFTPGPVVVPRSASKNPSAFSRWLDTRRSGPSRPATCSKGYHGGSSGSCGPRHRSCWSCLRWKGARVRLFRDQGGAAAGPRTRRPARLRAVVRATCSCPRAVASGPRSGRWSRQPGHLARTRAADLRRGWMHEDDRDPEGQHRGRRRRLGARRTRHDLGGRAGRARRSRRWSSCTAPSTSCCATPTGSTARASTIASLVQALQRAGQAVLTDAEKQAARPHQTSTYGPPGRDRPAPGPHRGLGTAHLVVLGSRGRGPLRSSVLGSVSASVARHAHCPVVVCRPGGAPDTVHGVLVGADGADASRPVLEFAFLQASLRGMPLTVMHCFWDVVAATAGPGVVPRGDDKERRRGPPAAAGRVGGRAGREVPRRRGRAPELARGLVDECLAAAAPAAELLVVGRAAATGWSRLPAHIVRPGRARTSAHHRGRGA